MAEPPLTGAATDAPDDGLLGLHGRLAREGFVAGPVELIAATRLLQRLREAGAGGDDLAALGPMLRAVYAKSAAEQRSFDAVYAAWAEGQARAAERARGDAEAAPAATAPPAPPPPGWWARVSAWVAPLLVLAIVLAATYLGRRDAPMLAAPDPAASAPAPGPVADTPPALPVVGAPAPATPAGLTGFAAPQRVQREFRPWVVALLLLLPLPLLLFVYAPALVFSRRHAERARSASAVTLDVSSWRLEAERVVPAMDLRTAARLDRHVLPRFDEPWVAGRRRLDLPRSLAATQRLHGRFTPRWRPPRARPSYLVLIDTRDEHDLRGRLFYRWADRMRRQGVSVEIWLFVGDPRQLHPADQRHVLDPQGRMRNPVRFEQVAARASLGTGARLVVVGDADAMFVQGAELQPWWRDLGWARWKERVWFTPRDARDWGEREVAIERPLARGDPGFLVLPLEQEALDAWAVQLTAGALPTIVLAATRRFPPLIERLPQQGLGDTPPDDAQVEKLVAQLRLYLGENGLRWLAAVALPPIVRWELTLLIGQELFTELGGDNEASLRWLMQTHYPRLARLPWLRHAHVPDWLALRLLHELSPSAQARVRGALARLFARVPPEDMAAAADRLTLDFAAPGGAAGAAPAAGAPPDDPARRRRQWLYLGFMDGLTPRELALRAPEAWRRLFTRLPPGRALGRGLRAAALLAAEALRALLARLMWRDGRAAGGASPWPLLVSAAWLVAVGLLLGVAARTPPGELAPALGAALLHEVQLGRGVVVADPDIVVAFSADGRRLAVADPDGRVEVRAVDADAALVGPPIQLGRRPDRLFLDATGQLLIAVDRREGVVLRSVASGAPVGDGLGRFDIARSNPAAVHRNGWLALELIGGVAIVDLRNPGASGPLPVRQVPLLGDVDFALGERRLVWTSRTVGQVEVGSVALEGPAERSAVALALRPEDDRVVLDPLGRFVAVLASGEVRESRQVGAAEVAAARAGEATVYRIGATLERAFVARFDAPLGSLRFGRTRLVAIAPRGDTGAVWTLATGAAVGTLTGVDGTAEFAPGTDLLVTRAGPTAVRTFDLGGSADVRPAPLGPDLVHAADLQAVAGAPGGGAVVTLAVDGGLRVWPALRLAADAPPAPAPAARTVALAVSADGTRVAVGTAAGEIVAWTPGRAAAPLRVPAHAAALRSLQFSADGTRLLSAATDGSVRLWDAALGTPVGLPRGLPEARRGLRADDGLRLALTFMDGRARVIDLGADGVDRLTPVNVAAGLADAQIDPADGRVLIARASPPEIAVWTLADGLQRSAAALLVPPAAPATRALPPAPTAPAAPTVRSACTGGRVTRDAFVGDPLCVSPARRAQVAADNAQRSARVSPTDRSFGPTTCEKGYVWREADRPLRGESFTDRVCVTPEERGRAAVEGKELFARRAQLVAAQTPRIANIANIAAAVAAVAAAAAPAGATTTTATATATIAAAGEPVRALRVGETGARPLIALGDRLAQLFDGRSLAPIGSAVLHPGLRDAAWVDDAEAGIALATAGADGAVRLWDVAGGRSVGAPLEHGAAVERIALGGGGRWLASADANGGVRVWNLRAGRPVPGGPTERSDAAAPFALAADGVRLVALSASGVPASWNLPASTTTGELRSVRIAASVWLALLVVAGAAALAVAAGFGARRARRFGAAVAAAGR